ncbi:hypothetical protein KIL84_012654 [Mauremys mutica]|uniref:Uncharacterized protein n=1 Tax=Mauremys mutica TaxID=74926 RepID=A0A9D3XRE5_9SAUR|nr:hypothetical protein KIL84_012654 [Mauremys mutica]
MWGHQGRPHTAGTPVLSPPVQEPQISPHTTGTPAQLEIELEFTAHKRQQSLPGARKATRDLRSPSTRYRGRAGAALRPASQEKALHCTGWGSELPGRWSRNRSRSRSRLQQGSGTGTRCCYASRSPLLWDIVIATNVWSLGPSPVSQCCTAGSCGTSQ